MAMEMTGSFLIPAPRERVWAGLNDPEVLKASIPGCETIEKVSDNEFAARVTARVGPVKATFGGKVTLSDLDPPQGYTISGEGQGGVAGFARGSAKVKLDDAQGQTLLSYAVEAHVGGKLAQVGSRLIDATAKKMAGDFFSRFRDAVAAEGENSDAAKREGEQFAAATPAEEETSREAGPQAPEAAAPAPTPDPGLRLSPAVWIPGLVVVVALALYFFVGHGAKP